MKKSIKKKTIEDFALQNIVEVLRLWLSIIKVIEKYLRYNTFGFVDLLGNGDNRVVFF